MGYFTWTFADRPLQETRHGDFYKRCKLPYGGRGHLLCPDGSVITEHDYEGYGIFDGKDVYELVVEWNKDYLRRLPIINNPPQSYIRELIDAYINGGDSAAQAYVDKAIEQGEAAPYLRKDWKRSLGIDISCGEKNKRLPYPIKIVSKIRHIPSYDQLPASITCQ